MSLSSDTQTPGLNKKILPFGILVIFILYCLLCLLGLGYGYFYTFITYIGWLIFMEILFLIAFVITISFDNKKKLDSVDKFGWIFVLPFAIIGLISYFQRDLVNFNFNFIYFGYISTILLLISVFLFVKSNNNFYKSLTFFVLIGLSIILLLSDLFSGYFIENCNGQKYLRKRTIGTVSENCKNPIKIFN
jgi:hypothetical protein